MIKIKVWVHGYPESFVTEMRAEDMHLWWGKFEQINSHTGWFRLTKTEGYPGEVMIPTHQIRYVEVVDA